MDAEQEVLIYENADSCLTSELKCLWNNCNQLFPKLDELAIHVNDEHVKMEKESDFACRWEGCSRKGRSFNARYKMLIHVRTHTNEKPHMCRQCGKSFSRLENLKIHNRSHTGEKPYICPIEGCGKAYSNSSDRFKHTRTHFVDKPYFCKKDGCNKRYTDPSSLRKHMKTYGHYREERTCIIKSKKDNKQCIGTCNGDSKSEAIVSTSKVKRSFLHSYADKINTTVLSASPVLTVNVPSLIPNPIFATNLLKPSFATLEKYYLVKTNGTSFDLNSFHNMKNETCPLDLTVKECSNDLCLNNENI